ncbi:MAG: alpha/beta fold hydrolase [Chloroflexota bacterium]|nr:alpha/beta fold hydrolase [Chloroflexota bacterium]
MKRTHLIPLVLLLLILVACNAGGPSHTASAPSPKTTPTPTMGITPTPTIPDIPAREVHFLTSDHVRLAGLLYGHGTTAVICSHELHTTRVIWSASGIAQRLAARGYLVLAYDFRGNGDSQGQIDMATLAVDVHAAMTFVRQQGATKIVLLGASMGGTATLKAAAHEQIAAVITLSAPQDFGVTVSETDLKAINAPKLFINSQGDDYAADTMHMYALASPPKEIHLYPGSLHGVDIFDSEHGADLTQRLLTFIAHYAPARSSRL